MVAIDRGTSLSLLCSAIIALLVLGTAVPTRADVASDVVEIRLLQGQSRWVASESLATAAILRERERHPADSLDIAWLQAEIVRSRTQRSAFRDSTLAPMARSVLVARTARLGAWHPLVAESHHALAHVLGMSGHPDSAEVHARRAHEIRAAVLAPDDTLTAESLRLHGLIARDRADFAAAVDLFDRALEVRRRAHGEVHAAVALLLAEKGHALRQVHAFDRARVALDQSLVIFDQLRGEDDFRRTVPLDYLAQLEKEAGQLDRSIDLSQEALRIARKHFPEDDDNVVRLMRNSSSALMVFGDFAGAREIMERAAPAYLRRFGPDHPRTLSARRSLGSARAGMGDSAGAIVELRAAEAGFAARPGPPDPQLATTRLWIGELLASRGDHIGARAAWESGIAAGKIARVPQWLTLSELQNGLVRTLAAIGDTVALARERTELLRLAAMPELNESNIAATILKTNALALRALGRETEAWEQALAADRIARERLRAQARSLPDRRALQLSLQYSRATDLVVELSAKDPEARMATAWDAVVRVRGLVRAEVASRRPPAGAPAAVVTAHGRWIEAQRAYARRLVETSQERDQTASIGALESAVERAEIEYLQVLGARVSQSPDVGLDSCLRRLEPGQALVGIIETSSGHDTARVVAWVGGGGDARLQRVDLGSSRALRAVVDPWRERLAMPPRPGSTAARRDERECRRLGQIVRAATWDRIAACFPDAREVFMVLDGPLIGLAWQALPDGHGYLVERGTILRVLTSERDLVQPRGARAPGGLLALGDPDFGSMRDASPLVAAYRSASDPCANGVAAFEALPGTAGEVQAIAHSWKGKVEVLTGKGASEQAFKSGASGREVLHIATHGLVARDTCAMTLPGARGIGTVAPLSGTVIPRPPSAAAAPDVASSAHSPWLGRRVWLALAGANRAADHAGDENEGLLTAEEVLTLDLSGTDWVVLSACHSAAAETWSREGSLGMRRAFHLAGARTVIASQWSIDDQATRQWMTALYVARSLGKGSPGETLAAASRAVLAQRRADRRSTHPFFWAAFDATGE